jgi:hypothetical protein
MSVRLMAYGLWLRAASDVVRPPVAACVPLTQPNGLSRRKVKP